MPEQVVPINMPLKENSHVAFAKEVAVDAEVRKWQE